MSRGEVRLVGARAEVGNALADLVLGRPPAATPESDDEEDRLSQAVVALGVLLPCLFVAYGVGLLKP